MSDPNFAYGDYQTNKLIKNVADTVTTLTNPALPRTSYTFSKTGTLSVATGAGRMYNDTGRTLTIIAVRASVGTAPTGATVIVDVNKNGTTIFTTQGNRPSIAIGANTVTATPAVTSWASGAYLSVDIDQVGSTVTGSDLSVTVVAEG